MNPKPLRSPRECCICAVGECNYLKLIKLLYMVDREALARWGRTVTADHYISMDNGPVLSRIYDLIREEMPKPIWSEFISAPLGDYEVELCKPNPPSDRLSRAEERLIEEVYGQYGRMNRWELVKLTHSFPEWKNPEGSSIPLHLSEILKALQVEDGEIRMIVRELHAERLAEELISTAH